MAGIGNRCSKRLRLADVGNIYYLRGYTLTKRYEFDAPGVLSMTLPRALADFRHCRRADPNHPKAPGAIRNLTQRLCRRASGSFVDLFGPLVIFIAGTVVFLFAQLDFVFREASIRSLFGLPVKISVIDNAMV